MNHSDEFEKRNFIRFPVSEDAMVAFTPIEDSTYYQNFGRIVDISRGGMAFDYEFNSHEEKGIGMLSLIGLEKSLFIKDVPVTTVYERDIPSTHRADRKKKRCGMMFDNLSEIQLAQMDAFIEHYAIRC